MDRPALHKLVADAGASRIDVIVVYKVDRLTRSLADFAKVVETFDAHGAAFVSVIQSFNSTSNMGRLTLNLPLSFAQFEREVTGERIRDKIAASKKKGMLLAGWSPWVTESRTAPCTSSRITQPSCVPIQAICRGDAHHR
jgi:site-specific DNA recombinase